MTVAELRRSARLLRVVAEAEIARLEGDAKRVSILLDGVDPVEAHELARRLDFDAGVRDVYFRTTPEARRTRTVW